MDKNYLRNSLKESMKVRLNYILACSEPADPTSMKFDVRRLIAKAHYHLWLSSQKEASYIAQWAENSKKSGKNFTSKFFLPLMDSRRRPVRPDRQTQCKHSENMCKFMPQCFQIWQVSAKYCTFLDFLAHCCALLSKSFWKRPSMMTIFWVTQWYRIVMKMNWKFLLISCQNPRYLLSLSHWTLKRGYSSKALEPHPVQMHVSTWVI